ncbi:MAG: hypothetical protein ACOYL3_06300 [Desulfuromonadaceae bacterium]
MDVIAVYRFCIQLTVVLAVGLITVKTWRHYRRNPYSFLYYAFLFLVLLFLHSAVKLGINFSDIFSAPLFPDTIMPMVEHVLKMGWVILFIYAFIVTISGMHTTKQYFLIVNLFLTVFISSTVWLNWLLYLDTTNPGPERFGAFWGQQLMEAWMALLLLYGLFLAWRVHETIRGAFLFMVTAMISQLLLHSLNIITSHNQIFWIFIVERMLILSFSAAMMFAAYRYSTIVSGGDGNSLDLLQ